MSKNIWHQRIWVRKDLLHRWMPWKWETSQYQAQWQRNGYCEDSGVIFHLRNALESTFRREVLLLVCSRTVWLLYFVTPFCKSKGITAGKNTTAIPWSPVLKNCPADVNDTILFLLWCKAQHIYIFMWMRPRANILNISEDVWKLTTASYFLCFINSRVLLQQNTTALIVLGILLLLSSSNTTVSYTHLTLPTIYSV